MGLIIIGICSLESETLIIAEGPPERGISINTSPDRVRGVGMDIDNDFKISQLTREPMYTLESLKLSDKKLSQQGWRNKKGKHIK